MKAHCLFEQSGTFKNAFKKFGIDAYDYDILDDFGETDYKVDLFDEINRGGQHVKSIFDNMTSDDIIMAFYPCTRFQENNMLLLSGKGSQQRNMTTQEKLYWSKRYHKELSQLYSDLCTLVQICMDRKLRLIIENPATQPHYLTMYWLPATIIDKDRTLNGDKFKKPTQYWFFNIEPKNNLIFEPIQQVEIEIINKIKGANRQVKRSMIEPQYAERFIRTWILDEPFTR